MNIKYLISSGLVQFLLTQVSSAGEIKRVIYSEVVSEGAVTESVHQQKRVWSTYELADTWRVTSTKPLAIGSDCPSHPNPKGDYVQVAFELGRHDYLHDADWAIQTPTKKAFLNLEEVQSFLSGKKIRIDIRFVGSHLACPNNQHTDIVSGGFGGAVWASCYAGNAGKDADVNAIRGQGYDFATWGTNGYAFDDTAHINLKSQYCTGPLRIAFDAKTEQTAAQFDAIEVTVWTFD
ncbi:MAG TPA: hypothetical protein VE954_08500 [Oligoflexus sp.]|uniref:hypothetical protein n=1 Tax=Oligoflexus sp. TaxID=1971216 RepID=UPI002D2B4BFA|nr:hypothetical protein [Oligoflexus sp.]HYX33143.1 hypothetical protein [Oligoflexus sp.]